MQLSLFLKQLLSDRVFCDYLASSNNRLGERQIVGLAKIAAFCKDRDLVEGRQGKIKELCLKEWQVGSWVNDLFL